MEELTEVQMLRIRMIKSGLELEMVVPGMRLTRKAPPCFKIITRDYGIKVNPRNKWQAYLEFCAMFGLEPKKADKIAEDLR